MKTIHFPVLKLIFEGDFKCCGFQLLVVHQCNLNVPPVVFFVITFVQAFKQCIHYLLPVCKCKVFKLISRQALKSITSRHMGNLFLFLPVCSFNSRTWVLVHLSFANDQFRRSSTKFQLHFKICLLWFLHGKECIFYTHLFCYTEMRRLFISSTAIWITGSDTGSVASRARTKLTSSKCDWTRIWAI